MFAFKRFNPKTVKENFEYSETLFSLIIVTSSIIYIC